MRARHHQDRRSARSAFAPLSHCGAPDFGDCVPALNQLLADTIMLRDLYRRHCWQVAGDAFYPLHMLFEKHCGDQATLADRLAERIMALGGAPVTTACDVVEMTRIARPPVVLETGSEQILRLLAAHDAILTFSHEAADLAQRQSDDATFALIAGSLVRLSELQVWTLFEHLTGAQPVERAFPASFAKYDDDGDSARNAG